MWTCRLDKDYHACLANHKTTLANTLQNDLEAQTTRYEQLTAKVDSLKEVNAKALAEVKSLKELTLKLLSSMLTKLRMPRMSSRCASTCSGSIIGMLTSPILAMPTLPMKLTVWRGL